MAKDDISRGVQQLSDDEIAQVTGAGLWSKIKKSFRKVTGQNTSTNTKPKKPVDPSTPVTKDHDEGIHVTSAEL